MTERRDVGTDPRQGPRRSKEDASMRRFWIAVAVLGGPLFVALVRSRRVASL